MTLFQALVLGVVQGITEFLPISSSGHLIIFPELLGWPQQGIAFDVTIHVATLLAIVWVLWADLVALLKHALSKTYTQSTALKIVVATIPVVIAGLALSSVMESIRDVRVVAAMLAVWGVILWVADAVSAKRKRPTADLANVSWSQALLVGVIQAFALIPGSSRSGVTISAGLFGGLDRRTAAKFSFLLAIPAIAGAGFLTAVDVAQHGLDAPVSALIVGFLAAFFSGALAIKFLLKLLSTATYRWFAVYRLLLAAALFVWVA